MYSIYIYIIYDIMYVNVLANIICVIKQALCNEQYIYDSST